MTTSFTILSIQVGQPQSYPSGPQGQPWTSGIRKLPVAGPVRASFTNLAGDAQADLKHHGGRDKAVYCYPSETYQPWQAELGRAELAYGSFGENLTTRGALEDEVCIGDVYRAGDVLVQVSQPRYPCYKLNRILDVPDLDRRLDAAARCGWYLRVLAEGTLSAGQTFELVERPAPGQTVALAYALIRDEPARRDEIEAIIRVPHLAESWRAGLKSKL